MSKIKQNITVFSGGSGSPTISSIFVLNKFNFQDHQNSVNKTVNVKFWQKMSFFGVAGVPILFFKFSK